MKHFHLFFFALIGIATGISQAGTVYFRAAELPGQEQHHDSFVVSLNAPADIAHARELIQLGPEQAGGSIIFAGIAAGSDGINANLPPGGSLTGPAWSWHVVPGTVSFGDFGIELLDGWPTYVEHDVAGWLRNTNGNIGFWNYTITGELSGEPTAGKAVPLPAALVPGMALLGIMVALPSILVSRRRKPRSYQ